MKIIVNGRAHDAQANVTIVALLESIGLASGRVAVEVNGRVISRGDFAEHTLRPNDRVEVVQFVGGG